VFKTLLINCSFLIKEPTGISAYTQNILPSLFFFQPILLASNPITNYYHYQIPERLNPDYGTIAHFRRLGWTQQQLPKIYKRLDAALLFSPIPEAPLYSSCRYVVTVHDLIPLRYPKRFSPLTPYFRLYIPQVLNQAKHIICNSQATADDMIHFWGIPARKITPILLAYDQQHFFPSPSSRLHPNETLTPATSIKNQPCRYFLHLGRPDPHKNVGRLIAAFAKVPATDNELWLIGPPRSPRSPLYTKITATGGRIRCARSRSFSQLHSLRPTP